MTNDEVDEVFRNTGFSRLPVYDDDLDEILGVLNQKDFHNYIFGKENSISDFVKPVAFVAGSMRLATLLRKLQQMKSHMAIIVDEYGGTEGLVTMEDIIEELVGEIYDEHDVVMSQQVTELQNGTYRVMCNANLANVFDYFGIEEEVDANTVNGWVVLCLDKLPEKGDTFEYTADFKRLKGRVTKANGKKAIEINLSVEVLPED
jgi:putative hemolysin